MRNLFTYWSLDFGMAIFMSALLVSYLWLCKFRLSKESRYFFAGFFLMILAISSPLHFLGENYLMSAHMTAHVLLLLISAPLMVLGIPADVQNKSVIIFSKKLFRVPWLGWMAGVCIMWFWHIPDVFNYVFVVPDPSVNSTLPGLLQDLHLISLVIAGLLFSLPIAGPVRSARLAPLNAVLYLSAACIFCSVLGLLITFSPIGIYTPFLQLSDRFALLHRIRDMKGISLQVDQQIAGLIMWVPGCLIYLTASMVLLMRWFRGKFESSNPASAGEKLEIKSNIF